jgi:penicillin-binding protein 1B
MAVRHPPQKKHGPSPAGRQSPRVVKYVEPKKSFWRRVLRVVLSPFVVVPVALLTIAAFGILGYFYHDFAGRIDQRLRGEVFTRSAGIYAAPKELRVGEGTSADELIARLKRAGYVEASQQADSARGRYRLNGAQIEIEPSKDAVIDGKRPFPRLRVAFARNGRSIAAITDADSGARLEKALLEPELISSVAGQSREKRKVIGFKDLPPHLVKAIIVTEDRTFFEHHGINLRGIIRALIRRYDADPNSPIARQGGSSITQQLVKNLMLSPEKTLTRKLAEAYMSIILETRLTKEEIFALYCNEVYLGQRAGFSINGFGEAAEAYFNKDVTALDLPEAAFLASIIRSPNRYNPYRNADRATLRRNQVLDSMAEAGAITKDEAERAKATPLKVVASRGLIDASEAPYFLDYVQNQLSDIVGDMSAAERLRVYTTIDMDLQRAAYTALTKQLAALDKIYAKKVEPGTLQAALVAMNARTGEIIAMVGGRDYEKSQLNRATDAMRQPGSVFKPFVYATALNTAYDPVPRVITAATLYKDEPKTFTFDNQVYSPGNFGDKYTNQPVTLRDALVKSLNVVTVDVAMEVTIGRVMNLAAKAGLPRPQRPYPAMALGASEATPLQVATAYTAFAANGMLTTPVAISRVTTGRGETVAAQATQKKEVLRPEVAFIMTSFMKDVVNRGTAARLRARGFKFNVAGKTGTSRDGWFAGYTPNIVCAVYVGFDNGDQLGLTGADSALPIWADFMTAALTQHPEWGGDWQMPEGIEQADIDTRTGQLAAIDPNDPNNPGDPSDPARPGREFIRTEYFISGTAPTATSDAPPVDPNAPENKRDSGFTYDPALIPSPTPPGIEQPPGPNATPRPDGASLPGGAPRLLGTITLDIDPTTGLIAAPTCPVIRSRTFIIGQEPTRTCGPEYHKVITVPPAGDARPRRVSP